MEPAHLIAFSRCSRRDRFSSASRSVSADGRRRSTVVVIGPAQSGRPGRAARAWRAPARRPPDRVVGTGRGMSGCSRVRALRTLHCHDGHRRGLRGHRRARDRRSGALTQHCAGHGCRRRGPASGTREGGRRCRFRAYRLHSPSACGALGTPPILGHRSRCRLPRLQRPLGDGGRQADLPRGHALVPRRRTRLMLVRVARPGSRARIRGVAHRRTALCRAPGRRRSARARGPVLVVACARASVRVGARGARTSRLVVADPDRSHP